MRVLSRSSPMDRRAEPRCAKRVRCNECRAQRADLERGAPVVPGCRTRWTRRWRSSWAHPTEGITGSSWPWHGKSWQIMDRRRPRRHWPPRCVPAAQPGTKKTVGCRRTLWRTTPPATAACDGPMQRRVHGGHDGEGMASHGLRMASDSIALVGISAPDSRRPAPSCLGRAVLPGDCTNGISDAASDTDDALDDDEPS